MSQCGGGNAEHSPVLVQAGNKTESVLSLRRKKPLTKLEKSEEEKNGVPDVRASPRSFHQSVKGRMVLRRQETLLHSNFSLSASCSSDCSMASFRSQASTGSIGRRSSRRKQGLPKGETILSKLEKIAPDSIVPSRPPGVSNAKRRCPWVTPNTDLCYRAFHDEEWGVPVHDDKKLFELLVLSGALAELTWPVILNKRKIFREVFLDFDPVGVSKLNEKKITAHGSIAGSLLTEPKLRAIVENAHQILKVIEEFGSFDKYCWSFVNQKPIISRFRYARQVPVKTPKADVISKDMVRRGFRSVGPTIIYTFMQVAGITNDHLISCHRFEECCRPSSIVGDKKDEPLKCDGKMEEIATFGASNVIELEGANIDLDLARVVEDLSVS